MLLHILLVLLGIRRYLYVIWSVLWLPHDDLRCVVGHVLTGLHMLVVDGIFDSVVLRYLLLRDIVPLRHRLLWRAHELRGVSHLRHHRRRSVLAISLWVAVKLVWSILIIRESIGHWCHVEWSRPPCWSRWLRHVELS